MTSVFLLTHSYEIDDEETVKIIGIYSSKEKAENTIEKYKNLPGFKDYPDSFCISEYEIDEDNWVEGFMKWGDALEELK